jgi:hypothetical protein
VRYRRVWLAAATVVIAVGVWSAVVGWSLVGALVTFAVTAVLGAGVIASVSRQPTWRQTRSAAAAVGTTAVAARGLSELLGGQEATLVLLALLAAAPRVIRGLRRRSTGPTPSLAHASALPSMSDLELCEAWSTSYIALQDAPTAAERVRVVALRQAYLDELEHRNPQGLQRWLSAGALATGNPSRFLV